MDNDELLISIMRDILREFETASPIIFRNCSVKKAHFGICYLDFSSARPDCGSFSIPRLSARLDDNASIEIDLYGTSVSSFSLKDPDFLSKACHAIRVAYNKLLQMETQRHEEIQRREVRETARRQLPPSTKKYGRFYI